MYIADSDDLLDQHVAYYFRHHAEIYRRHHIVRKRPGVYELNGREIAVEWQYGVLPGEQGFLVAIDGPLRQPFADYMAHSEANAEYVSQGLGTNALSAVPQHARMTFDDNSKPYSRLEAMKVAKEQALVRERAAEYAQQGMAPPMDLRKQYEKTLAKKLHGGRQIWAPKPEPRPPQEFATVLPPNQQQEFSTLPPQNLQQPTAWPGYPASAQASPGLGYQAPQAALGNPFSSPPQMFGGRSTQQMPQMPMYNFGMR